MKPRISVSSCLEVCFNTSPFYETGLTIALGPDATPVVLPLREFGKEHHRKLSSLPQIPQLASSPSSRLVMSFWDREISIWRVSRGPISPYENADGQRHRLVGKVLIQVRGNRSRDPANFRMVILI